MDGLVAGIDLCDDYTKISCLEEEKTWTIPTVICKKKGCDEWYVGEEAYACALEGKGIIVDKLVDMVQKDRTSTIEGIRYEGVWLLERFLKSALTLPLGENDTLKINQLVVALKNLDDKLMKALCRCADDIGADREHFHLISREESFIYYILSQKKELWNNQVGMFDLENEHLHYFEMKVRRGLKQTMVVAESEEMEEGFNLDILNTAAGCRLADRILCSCAERYLQKKLFSAIFLSGKGFHNREWAAGFMKILCDKRKVYMEENLFSMGAACKAADLTRDKTSYPYTLICQGRLNTTISLDVIHKGREGKLVLASAGDLWYETIAGVDLIPDNQEDIGLQITPPDPKKKKLVKIPLENFPKRPNRTTKVHVDIRFLDEKTMVVTMKDKGFGELFPASDAEIRQEVMI